MPNSLNGWPVLKPASSLLVTKPIPGVKGRKLTMRGDVLPLFLALAHDYHYWISALNVGPVDEGGYAYRQARNADAWSNHASGTAMDLNWSMEGAQGSTMGRKFFAQPDVARAIRTIDAIYGDVIDWGGRWRLEDFMHWEISPAANLAEVKALIRHLGITAGGVRTRNAMGEPIPPRD